MIERVKQKIGPVWLRRIQIIVPFLIALAFVAVETRRVSHQIAIRYPDFFGWAERAASFNIHNLDQWRWVHGLYPLGYPLLLRLGVDLGLDVLQTAFVISIFGGFIGLLGTFLLSYRMTGNWLLSVLTEFSLGCMAYYLFFANLDATDMLSAGLQICSLALIMGEDKKRWEALVAGLLVGWSYLIRYTASVTVLPCVLFLLLPFLLRRDRESLIITGFYLFGAAAGGAPQFLASWIVKGNPLYNEQAHNLWFHLQNSADYIRKWREVPMDISMREVVSADPKAFLVHWWEIYKSYFLTGDGYSVDGILGLFTHAGFWFALLASGEFRRPAKAFMLIYVAGFIALLSFTRLDRRFLITLMPLQVLASLNFIWTLLPEHIEVRKWNVPVRVPLILLIMLTYPSYPLGFMRSNPFDEVIVEVSNTLHAAGMQTAGEVFTTHTEYHDVADKWKTRYDMAAFIGTELSTYDEILSFIHAGKYRYFIFDRVTGLYMYPDQEPLLNPENRPAGLTPIYIPDKREAIIYRVDDAQWPEPNPVDAKFDLGITLDGYTYYQSCDQPEGSGQRVGLYLHWHVPDTITQSEKVFVHILNDQGQLVAQHDGVPALWTYPTYNWKAGETVVDFHNIQFDSVLPAGPYTLVAGLYDQYTGGRLPVLDDNGQPAGDFVALEVLELEPCEER